MKRTIVNLSLAAVALAMIVRATAAPVTLGSAADFAVLAGSGISFNGVPSQVTGDIGSHPTGAITGSFALTGTNHGNDAVTETAKVALKNAYSGLIGLAPTQDLTGSDLGGLTLSSGVYAFATSAALTGTLMLDALGDPEAAFVFKMGSTLTTAADSQIVLINSAQRGNIFWQVGSSATLGATSWFQGNLLAHTSISMGVGAVAEGRLLANARGDSGDGAITFAGDNTVIIPEPRAMLLLICGVIAMLGCKRRVVRAGP